MAFDEVACVPPGSAGWLSGRPGGARSREESLATLHSRHRRPARLVEGPLPGAWLPRRAKACSPVGHGSNSARRGHRHGRGLRRVRRGFFGSPRRAWRLDVRAHRRRRRRLLSLGGRRDRGRRRSRWWWWNDGGRRTGRGRRSVVNGWRDRSCLSRAATDPRLDRARMGLEALHAGEHGHGLFVPREGVLAVRDERCARDEAVDAER